MREVSRCERYRKQFEQLGEARVREKLQNVFGFFGDKIACAEEWLAELERERLARAVSDSAAALRAASAAESANSIARSARRSARFANIIAMIAIISSVITTIFGDQIRSWIFQLIR